MKLSKKCWVVFQMKLKWSLSEGFCAATGRFNLVIVQSDTQKLEDKSVSPHLPQFCVRESAFSFKSKLCLRIQLFIQKNMRPIPSKCLLRRSPVSYRK